MAKAGSQTVGSRLNIHRLLRPQPGQLPEAADLFANCHWPRATSGKLYSILLFASPRMIDDSITHKQAGRAGARPADVVVVVV